MSILLPLGLLSAAAAGRILTHKDWYNDVFHKIKTTLQSSFFVSVDESAVIDCNYH